MHEPSNAAPERAVERLAARQRALVTRTQAFALGMSRQQVAHRQRSRRWTPVHRGVYALAGSPDSWERKVLAAILAVGPGAVASHGSAAVLLGLEGAHRGRVEVTYADTTPRRLPVVSVHRTKVLEPEDVTECDGIASTSVARTLVDLTGSWAPGRLVRAVDDALVRKLVTRRELVAVTDRLGPAPGRKVGRLRSVVAERGPEWERADSIPEGRLVALLNRSDLPAAVQQHPVVLESHEYRIDAAYPQRRIAVEYFGFDPHRTRQAFGHDHRRHRLLTTAGWTVLTFTRDDSDRDIVGTVRAALSDTTGVSSSAARVSPG